MTVLLYIAIPVGIVAVAAMVVWARNRQPTSLHSGVESFRREMEALSPDANRLQQRRPGPPPSSSSPPRRPPGRS